MQLYGATLTSSESGLGNTHVEKLNFSLYCSATVFKIYVPRPEPVPPPREWIKKNPSKESHFSACPQTLSIMSSSYIGPYSKWPYAQLFPAPP